MQALIIFKDVTEEGDESEEEGEEEEGEEREEGEEEERGVGEVRWFVPEGFQVAAEPETLDTTLIGRRRYDLYALGDVWMADWQDHRCHH